MEYTKPEALRKWNSRMKESEEQRQMRLSHDKERKRQKWAADNTIHVLQAFEKEEPKKGSTETNEEWDHRLNTEKERKCVERARNDEQIREETQLTDVVRKPLENLRMNNISTIQTRQNSKEFL